MVPELAELLDGATLGTAYSWWMIIGVAIASKTWLGLNAYEIWKAKSSRGISIPAIGVHMAASANWVLWGFLRRDLIVVVSALITLALLIANLALIFIVNLYYDEA